jgi:hypothetical protein
VSVNTTAVVGVTDRTDGAALLAEPSTVSGIAFVLPGVLHFGFDAWRLSTRRVAGDGTKYDPPRLEFAPVK